MLDISLWVERLSQGIHSGNFREQATAILSELEEEAYFRAIHCFLHTLEKYPETKEVIQEIAGLLLEMLLKNEDDLCGNNIVPFPKWQK